MVGDRLRQDLDGDFAVQLVIAGFIDFAHAAFAQEAEDLVRAEFVAGGEEQANVFQCSRSGV
jgi:hypothetical protein